MTGVIILIIFFGIIFGVVIFFLIKSIIAPKRIASVVDLLKQGKSSSVIRLCRQIHTKDSRNGEAHFILGKAYLLENKTELALMEFRTVNQIGVFGGVCKEKEFRETIADLFEKFDQHEESLKEYLLLIKMEPNNAEYYFRAGVLFESRDKADKAVNYFRKALELNPRHSNAHFHLGYILYRSKKPVESRVELEYALKIQPDNFQAHFYLGKLLKDNHDYAAALLSLEKAQRDPELKVKALVERGGCYMSMNNLDRAISELERAVGISRNDAATETLFARYFLSLCYEKQRDIDKAIEQWEKIYVKKPNFRDVAEKLSSYQDLRSDDRMKDYLTSSMDTYYEICKNICVKMDLNVRDISDIPNGCQIIAVESDARWRNVRKMPKLMHFLRIQDIISESTIRNFQELMKKFSVQRGVIFTSSTFSRTAMDFAESRPIDLINKDKLQELLSSIDMPAPPGRKTP